jgi:hypothetical protein
LPRDTRQEPAATAELARALNRWTVLGSIFATEAQGHAAASSYPVSFSVPARHAAIAPPGLIGPAGQWLGRGPQDGTPSVVVAGLDDTAGDVETAVFRARPWRRTARAGRYTPHVVHDPAAATGASF